MVFSTNQVRQLYVAKNVPLLEADVKPSDAPGAIKLVTDTAKTHMYFQYKGADNLMRSDLIPLKNIISATSTKAEKMKHALKSIKVSLDPAVNSGNPIVGEDYIVKVFIRQYLGMSDDSTTQKFGAVHTYAGMTKEKFYITLTASLFMNFSREEYPLVKFLVSNGESLEEVVSIKKDTKTKDIKLINAAGKPIVTTSIDGVTIQEYPQEWVLGTKSQDPVFFDVVADDVTLEGNETPWAVIEDTTAVTKGEIKNGTKIADLEYFCMSERGDVYKNMGWPNVIPTTYLIDPTKEYDTLDIHYYFEGGNEGPQKSEKTVTIVCEKGNGALATLITAFNKLSTITGITVASVA